MRKARNYRAGTIHAHAIDSHALAGNLLGDPTRREVPVYVPAGHSGKGLPLLVDLVGFTAGGPVHVAWKNFGENVPERLDRLIGAEGMPPVVVAFPDCFTRLGGNQYINSEAVGRWEDFLVDEVVTDIEARFQCGGSGRRGVFGKSSGGYGAIVHALRRSDVWSAAACHSGDLDFAICYMGAVFDTVRLLGKHDRSIETFIARFEAAPKKTDADLHALMTLAMAATYDPAPSAFLGIRLPVDLETGTLIAERWRHWLDWDPVRLVDGLGDNLKRLKALYIDCGTEDQYNLIFGARQLHRKLTARGIAHRYEEFPDNHTGIDYRMDESLPFLAKALSA
ncbi:MAG TPA: alpha/beta hydrolase-fold protein [Stellaceae bacterium]|nr:alpha/beta hydrolase-fold protein [Stellaceae bacterium]